MDVSLIARGLLPAILKELSDVRFQKLEKERFFLLLRIGKTISGRIDQRNFLESIFRQVIPYLVSIYFDLSETIDDSWKKKVAGLSYNLCIKIFMRIRA